MTHPRAISVLSLQSEAILAGSALMNYTIIEQLDRSWFPTDVCFLFGHGPLSKRYQALGCPVHHLGYKNCLSVPLVSWRLRDLLQSKRYHVLHAFGLKANVIARLVAQSVRNPPILICGVHSVDAHRKQLHNLFESATARWVQLYISNSIAGARVLRSRDKLPEAKIVVIHNGIDADEFGPVSATPNAEECVTLICVAHLRKAKGYKTLLEAARMLAERGRKFRLMIVGEGPDRRMIESLVEQWHLRDVVALLGLRDDVKGLLRKADVFVLCSEWEGMPGAIMEAMAAGLPIVASNVGGVPELVTEKETGFLVPSGSPSEFADRLSQLIDEPELRMGMGANAAKKIRAEFGLGSKVRELERVYESLVSRAPVVPSRRDWSN
jgi:glycosyltransferase involved in cell wall biosynthesis